MQNVVTDEVSSCRRDWERCSNRRESLKKLVSIEEEKKKSFLLNLGADNLIYGLPLCLQSPLHNGHTTWGKLKEMSFHCISLSSMSSLLAPIVLPQLVTFNVAKNGIECYVHQTKLLAVHIQPCRQSIKTRLMLKKQNSLSSKSHFVQQLGFSWKAHFKYLHCPLCMTQYAVWLKYVLCPFLCYLDYNNFLQTWWVIEHKGTTARFQVQLEQHRRGGRAQEIVVVAGLWVTA